MATGRAWWRRASSTQPWRSAARTLVASITARRRFFSRAPAIARTSSNASAVTDWSVSSSATSARQRSEETISVGANQCAAKLDLPEPVAPISTTRQKSGSSIRLLSGALIG
ncbi:hypothetical protein SH611_17975 [Geminicoccaceae bacterium 1502E]|nr:hypothetical protein [Geminicoccaceae bacterium 1502E]